MYSVMAVESSIRWNGVDIMSVCLSFRWNGMVMVFVCLSNGIEWLQRLSVFVSDGMDWKTLGHEEAEQALRKRQEGRVNYHTLIYGDGTH